MFQYVFGKLNTTVKSFYNYFPAMNSVQKYFSIVLFFGLRKYSQVITMPEIFHVLT